jgi:hypothetical protein
MLRWWRTRGRKRAIEAEAEAWIARHGAFAYRLAGERSLDAYFTGDLAEQERWSELRAVIREALAPGATSEELDPLSHPSRPLLPRSSKRDT